MVCIIFSFFPFFPFFFCLQVLHAGTKLSEEPVGGESSGALLTAGGRVLAVSAVAETLKEAVQMAYKGIDCITFEGAQYRKDIGALGLK